MEAIKIPRFPVKAFTNSAKDSGPAATFIILIFFGICFLIYLAYKYNEYQKNNENNPYIKSKKLNIFKDTSQKGDISVNSDLEILEYAFCEECRKDMIKNKVHLKFELNRSNFYKIESNSDLINEDQSFTVQNTNNNDYIGIKNCKKCNKPYLRIDEINNLD